ncbi:MAG: phosphoribosylaminoimidazolecarboxamide formyltransferase [Actinomycetota bacterium]
MDLRYGLNPGQRARAVPIGGRLPFRVLSGEPSYVNLLDALSAWHLVREISESLGLAAAASFKHVSPAGAAIPGRLDDVMRETWSAVGEVSPIANAYIRARDADPKSSYGDFVAVSEPVDQDLVEVLRRTANDGVIAPGFEPGTVDALKAKKGGRLLVLEVEPGVARAEWERREIFGVSLEQQAPQSIDRTLPALRGLPSPQLDDAVLAMLAVRYTQSNSVGLARDGMMIGIGADQQSRVDCVRLAGGKADSWWLRRHPRLRQIEYKSAVPRQDRINLLTRLLEGDLTESDDRALRDALAGVPPVLSRDERSSWLQLLSGVVLVSDGMVPFRDNVDQAARHGVNYLLEPGGSIRSDEVTEACRAHGIVHVQTGIRLFCH